MILWPRLVLIVGGVLMACGIFGLLGPRFTQDDGAVLIAGAVLFGAGAIASSLRGGNKG